MTGWTSGYMADIDYTYGYYAELNPIRVKLALLNNRIPSPHINTACELGFGQGLSVNLHAAASTTEWFGTDFNPAQAGFAQELAQAASVDAKLFDEAFLEFVHRPDLPEFDYIGLHGIWSWISDENRHTIVDFLHRKLKVGGVVYVSYNTFPGWAAFAPMRHLMVEHAEILGSEGRGIVSRVNGAIDFTEKLLATNPLFLRANPLVGERLKQMAGHSRHYLAHEYFNKDWHPMHFATMAEWLSSAKMQYSCSAHYLDQIDSINLTPEQSKFLKELPDPMFQQSVRDFMVNQQFRRDYWVKGLRRINPLEQVEQLRKLKFVLIKARGTVSLTVAGSLGTATMSEDIYGTVLNIFSDHRVHSLGEIEQSVINSNIRLNQLLEVVFILCGQGSLAPAQDDNIAIKAKNHCDKLNRFLFEKAKGSGEISYVASPVTGGGIQLGRFEQLFALAFLNGRKKSDELSRFTWDILSAQGQRLVKDGSPLQTEEENLAQLETESCEFINNTLPIIKALRIV